MENKGKAKKLLSLIIAWALVCTLVLPMQVSAKSENTFKLDWKDINDGPGGASPLGILPGKTVVVKEGRDYDLYGDGAGSICWYDNVDTFHYAYTRLKGDFQISVKISDIAKSNTNPGRSGIVIRESLCGNSPTVDFVANSSAVGDVHDIGRFGGRDEYGKIFDNWPTIDELAFKFPIWLRIKRSGNNYQASYSKDGKVWKVIGTRENQLPDVVYVGLGTNAAGGAKFRDLDIQGVLAPSKATPPKPGNGSGLTGRYFDGRNFDTPVFTRIDKMINNTFTFGQSPDPSMGFGEYSAIWTGYIVPLYTEKYKITLGVDDGGRMWFEDEKVVDKWRDEAYANLSFTKDLVAGKKYKVKIEYFEGKWGGGINLFWRSPSQDYEVIPQSQLYPDESYNVTSYQPPVLISQNTPGAVYEAEQCEFGGGAAILNGPHYSCSNVISNTGGKDAYITIKNIDGGKEKSLHSFQIAYIAPSISPFDMYQNIYVNGKLIDKITFFSGDHRDGGFNAHIMLNPGRTNTITIKNDAGSIADVLFDKFILDGEIPFMVKEPLNGKKPDLVVTDVSYTPQNAIEGDNITFKATIKNIGSLSTPQGITHGVGFLVDNTYVNWADNFIGSLAPGQSITLTATGGPSEKSTWEAMPGEHRIKAFVDDVNRMDEISEDNNNMIKDVVFRPNPKEEKLPDLVVTDIKWEPSNPAARDGVALIATVKNQGSAATPDNTVVGVGFSIESSVVAWADTYSKSIAPGETVTLKANGGPDSNGNWEAIQGGHNVIAFVDDVNRIKESNDNNNTYSTYIDVK